MSEWNVIRRRLRFSLRTLFVVITLVACWLGYHMHWIGQRNQARAWIAEQAKRRSELEEQDRIEAVAKGGPVATLKLYFPTPGLPARFPLSLWVLREQREEQLFVDLPEDESTILDRLALLQGLFPEARIMLSQIPPVSNLDANAYH